jgi:RNA polymerase sigma-70 factor (family 1)
LTDQNQTYLPDNTPDEKELLQRIAEGDESAFSLLFHHYQPGIYTVAYKLTQQSVVSEEIVQDVFLKIWLKRTDLPELEVFPAWLFKIARYTIFSALRKLYREKQFQHELSPEVEQLALHNEDAVLEKELGDLLKNAINRLPEKQRITYELIKVQGLKRELVAKKLGISSETVKSNLDQAMKNIRAYCVARTELGILLLLTMGLK